MPETPEKPNRQITTTPDSGPGKVVSYAAHFSGPLPPPPILEQYERVCPGASDRIFGMAESEAEHRRGIENRAVDADIEAMRRQFGEARLGQVFAFLISIAFVVSGAYVVSATGQTATGLILSAAGLTTIVATFIRGRAEEEESKPSQPQQPARKKRKH